MKTYVCACIYDFNWSLSSYQALKRLRIRRAVLRINNISFQFPLLTFVIDIKYTHMYSPKIELISNMIWLKLIKK